MEYPREICVEYLTKIRGDFGAYLNGFYLKYLDGMRGRCLSMNVEYLNEIRRNNVKYLHRSGGRVGVAVRKSLQMKFRSGWKSTGA